MVERTFPTPRSLRSVCMYTQRHSNHTLSPTTYCTGTYFGTGTRSGDPPDPPCACAYGYTRQISLHTRTYIYCTYKGTYDDPNHHILRLRPPTATQASGGGPGEAGCHAPIHFISINIRWPIYISIRFMHPIQPTLFSFEYFCLTRPGEPGMYHNRLEEYFRP